MLQFLERWDKPKRHQIEKLVLDNGVEVIF